MSKPKQCWLVGQNPETDEFSVVEAETVGDPVDGHQVVRVGMGCGIMHTLSVDKVHFDELSAVKRMAELEAARGVVRGGVTVVGSDGMEHTPEDQLRFARRLASRNKKVE